MEKALQKLRLYIKTKDVHSFEAIYDTMLTIHEQRENFGTLQAQKEFVMLITEFQTASKQQDRRSWGKNAFTIWLDNWTLPNRLNRLIEPILDPSEPPEVSEEGTGQVPANPPLTVANQREKKVSNQVFTHLDNMKPQYRLPRELLMRSDCYLCPVCNEHNTQCICQLSDTEDNQAFKNSSLLVMVNQKPYAITRHRAMQLREIGLRLFSFYITKWIEHPTVRAWTMRAMELAPLYFWVAPATISGKYHTEETSGIFGLLKHSLATGYMAKEYCPTFNVFNTPEIPLADLTRASALIHDNCKYGFDFDPRYYEIHQVLLRTYYGKRGRNICKGIPESWLEEIFTNVETHQGDLTGNWGIPKIAPNTPSQMLVHIADVTTGRKEFRWAGWDNINKEVMIIESKQNANGAN